MTRNFISPALLVLLLCMAAAPSNAALRDYWPFATDSAAPVAGRDDRELRALKESAAAAPDNRRIRLALAQAYANRGLWADAESAFRKAGLDTLPARRGLAEALLNLGQYQDLLDAIVAPDEADRTDDAFQIRRLRAMALTALQPEHASAAWQALIAQRPQSADGYVGAASAALAQHHLNEAERLSEAALQRAPTNAEALTQRGDIALQQGQPRLALEKYRQATAADANNLNAVAGQIRAALTIGDLAQASQTAEGMRRRFPGHPLSGLMLASVRLAEGNLTEAETYYNGVAAQLDDDPQAALTGAMIKMRIPGAEAQAETLLQRYVTATPDDWRARVMLGNLLLRNDRVNAARDVFDDLLRVRAEYAPALDGLLGIALHEGALEPIVATAQRLQRADPRAPSASMVLRLLCRDAAPCGANFADGVGLKVAQMLNQLERGAAADGLRQAEEALRAHADHPLLQGLYARALQANGRFKEAEARFADLLRRSGDDITIALMWMNGADAAKNPANVLALLESSGFAAASDAGAEHSARFAEATLSASDAERVLRARLSVAPDAVTPRAALVRLLVRSDRLLDAKAELQTLLGTPAPEALQAIVAAALDANEPAVALNMLQRGWRSASPTMRAQNVGLMCALKNRVQKTAIAACLQQAMHAFPHERALADAYAVAQRNAGNLAEAQSVYRAQLQADPDDALALANWALTLQAGGHKSEALSMAERAYRLQPNNPAVADAFAQLTPDPQAALEACRLAMRAAADNPSIVYHYAQAAARAGLQAEAAAVLHDLQQRHSPR